VSKIISVHSYRGGTGKSNTAANLAAVLAAEGHRVGVVDTDIQSPGIHILFGLGQPEIHRSLNDFLWGRCHIKEAAHDVTPALGPDVTGKVFLIPSSMKAGDIAKVLREGYDVGVLRDGLHELIDALALDVLVIDTHPGLNEETLLSIAISDALVVVLRPDQQDYQGTSVTVEVARKLDVPRLVLVVNKVPSLFDPADVRARVHQTYGCEVAAVLPHSDEMMALASSGLFVLRHPGHPITSALRQVVATLVA
jgi:MinD-like ATPase involved in chromosome partitioning or flagellar assembly